MFISDKLSPLLEEITSYLNQLLEALHSEYQILTSNNLDLINEVSQNKILLMEHLEDLNKERLSILKTAGIESDSRSMESFFDNHPEQQIALLKKTWHQISKLTTDCEKQNNLNGMIIESNKRHTENALSVLQGKQQGTELYTKKGSTIKSQNKQTLVRA